MSDDRKKKSLFNSFIKGTLDLAFVVVHQCEHYALLVLSKKFDKKLVKPIKLLIYNKID